MTRFTVLTLRLAVILTTVTLARTGRVAAAEPTPLKWNVDGVERTAFVVPPSANDEGNRKPVIFAFHGHGGTALGTMKGMGFQRAWPGAIVVYLQGLPTVSPIDPQGLKPGWQREPGDSGNRDLKFVDAVLATLHQKYSVDDRRIFAAGFSNGGFFTYLLWSQRGGVFAAYAPCAAMIVPNLQLNGKRPALITAGQMDKLVPFDGQVESINAVRKHNDCIGPGQPAGEGCTLYRSKAGAPVMTFIHPGGHLFPKEASRLIVAFFKEHVPLRQENR